MSDQNKKRPLEEVVASDDAAVGTGIRYSLIAVAVLAVAAGVAFALLKPKSRQTTQQVTRLAAPQTAATSKATTPVVQFTDITADAGIRFRHFNGAYGDKLLPETMGGGVACFDFDGDGDPDLLFVNSTTWPWKMTAGQTAPTAALYRNDTQAGGPIRFADVTAGSGLDIPLFGMGAAVGDADNDGNPDVLITAVGGSRLFKNLGNGKFSDVTRTARVGGEAADWSTAAAWFDADNDGDLDLYVANYVRWSREIDAEVGYKLTGGDRAYGPPMNFSGAFPHFYRNDGTGTFTETTATSGFQVKNSSTKVPAAKTLGLLPIDLNNDGWIDLIAANDTVQNFVFTNRHDGTFQEVGALSGLAFDSYGATRGAMGIDGCRFTKDGKIAVAIGNFANEMTAFYVAQNEPMLFTDESIAWGIGGPSRDPLKFGIQLFDYDLDGRPDLLTINGHLEEEIGKIQHGQQYAQKAQLFWNSGDAGFVLVGTNDAGPDLFQSIVGRGSAIADFDADGDPDIVMTQLNGPAILLRNDLERRGNRLRIRVTTGPGSRDAIGAVVEAEISGQTYSQQVMPTRSYLSQSESILRFPHDTDRKLTKVTVRWPGGASSEYTALPDGTISTRTQPRTRPSADGAKIPAWPDSLWTIAEPR